MRNKLTYNNHLVLAKWLLIISLSGCRTNVLYTATTNLSHDTWERDNILSFEFAVEDTAQPYNIYLIIKNTPVYPYQNLYVTYYLKDANLIAIDTKLNNYFLAHPKTGASLGKGWTSNKYHEVVLIKDYYFSSTGAYVLQIAQFMRKKALEGISSIGIKVVKVSA